MMVETAEPIADGDWHSAAGEGNWKDEVKLDLLAARFAGWIISGRASRK